MKKKKTRNNSPKVSQKLQSEFEKFLEYAPAGRFSNNLRNLLLWYLIHAQGEYFIDMDNLLSDLTTLFDLLDVATEEYPALDKVANSPRLG